MKRKYLPLAISLLVGSTYTHAATFVMEKNNQDFSIDGNNGAKIGQQLYLWNTNASNVNQNWVQLDRGNGYYSYKKQDTNLCWDGGNGGARLQAVTLQTCDEDNQNQHWKKVKVTTGTEIYRFEKRNASGWSIDGNGGAAQRQSLYLWNSNSNNVNQQWELTRTDEATTPISTDVLFLQHTDSGEYYALNSSNQLALTASTTGAAQGLKKVSKDGGYVFQAVGGNMDGMYAYEPSGADRQEMTADLSSAEVFFEYDCGDDAVYFLSNASGGTLKNQSNDMLGNNSSGDCGSSANEFTWVNGSGSNTPTTPTPTSTPTTPTPTPTSTPTTPTPTPTSTPVPTPTSTPVAGTIKIPAAITNGSLWDLEGENPNPLVNDYTLEFVALEAKVTTPNGNGWRHEYKIKESERKAMTAVYEDFKATIKVDLSTGGKTIVAQHHAGDTGTIMKLYVSDTSESGFNDSIAANGIFDVYVRIRNTSGVEEKKALGTIRTGGSFDFQVINDYGVVNVIAFGQNLETEVEDDSESYLKFGNYLQSQYPQGSVDCGESGDSDSFADCFKDIGITTSKITMTNVSYTRLD